MERKGFLRLSGYSITSFLMLGAGNLITACKKMGMGNMINAMPINVIEGNFTEELHMPPIVGNTSTLIAQAVIVPIAGIGVTKALGYQNQMLLGPTINLSLGQAATITLINQLNENTNIHWHGLKVPANMDGHPDNVVASGGTFNYRFSVGQRAGSYFYHPHVMGTTAKQVFQGLAGLIIVNDAEESALKLPSGTRELALIIQDKKIVNKSIDYSPTMMEQMTGFMGQSILVNGIYSPIQFVETAKYRIRILNGSNARIYNLAFSNSAAFSIIGNDGGLISEPEVVNEAILAPGERLDIIADFSTLSLDDEIYLMSKIFDAGSVQGKQEFKILKFKVNSKVTDSFKIPSTLSSITLLSNGMALRTREFDIANKNDNIGMSNMKHTINGKSFDPNRIDEKVSFSSIETWIFDNSKGSEPHPMHLHGNSFQVLSRTGGRGSIMPSEKGWKDVVLCMPGEKVKVIIPFNSFTGKYVFHCHNLEHEDNGMMAQYEIL